MWQCACPQYPTPFRIADWARMANQSYAFFNILSERHKLFKASRSADKNGSTLKTNGHLQLHKNIFLCFPGVPGTLPKCLASGTKKCVVIARQLQFQKRLRLHFTTQLLAVIVPVELNNKQQPSPRYSQHPPPPSNRTSASRGRGRGDLVTHGARVKAVQPGCCFLAVQV